MARLAGNYRVVRVMVVPGGTVAPAGGFWLATRPLSPPDGSSEPNGISDLNGSTDPNGEPDRTEDVSPALARSEAASFAVSPTTDGTPTCPVGVGDAGDAGGGRGA